MKIFINEIQIDILYKLLTEEKYDAVAKGVKPGDELKIVDKNNDEIKFSVVSNDGGRLYLKSAIKGNIYTNDFFFKDLSDIDNNSVALKRINTPAEFRNIDDDLERLKKVLNKYPIDTWKPFTFRTIKQLYLNDIDIDMNDKQAQKQAQQQAQGSKNAKNYTPVTDPGEVGDLLSDFRAFKEGSDYNFTLIDGGVINTNLFDNKGGSLNFKVKSLNGSATKYTDLENADIRLDVNANNIKKYEYYDKDTDETSTYYNITFKSVLGGTGSGSERPVTVKYITDINLTRKKEPKIPSREEVNAMNSVDITKLVTDHPEMKNAFFQRDIFGKYKGVIPANKTIKSSLNKYFDTLRELEKLYAKFTVGSQWEIKLVDSFKFDNLYLDMNKLYPVKAARRPSDTVSGVKSVILIGESPQTIGGKTVYIKYKVEIKGYNESIDKYITTIWVNGKPTNDITMAITPMF